MNNSIKNDFLDFLENHYDKEEIIAKNSNLFVRLSEWPENTDDIYQLYLFEKNLIVNMISKSIISKRSHSLKLELKDRKFIEKTRNLATLLQKKFGINVTILIND